MGCPPGGQVVLCGLHSLDINQKKQCVPTASGVLKLMDWKAVALEDVTGSAVITSDFSVQDELTNCCCRALMHLFIKDIHLPIKGHTLVTGNPLL